jgi:hypothetical protein
MMGRSSRTRNVNHGIWFVSSALAPNEILDNLKFSGFDSSQKMIDVISVLRALRKSSIAELSVKVEEERNGMF